MRRRKLMLRCQTIFERQDKAFSRRADQPAEAVMGLDTAEDKSPGMNKHENG